MQKKLIALAIAGLASTAAFAQSNVTLYGVADVAIDGVSASGDSTGANANIGNVVRVTTNSSHIGIKGTEDLGNGLKALFQFETGFNVDTGVYNGAGRDTYVGLAGSFGTVTAGNLTTASRALLNRNEMLPGNAGVGTAESVIGATPRLANAVQYKSNDFNGFNFSAAYAAGEVGALDNAAAGTKVVDNAKTFDIGLNYATGAWDLGYAFQRYSSGGDLAAATDTIKNHLLGVGYNFDGGHKVTAMWNKTTVDTFTGVADAEQTAYSLQGKYMVSPAGSLIAEYTVARDATGNLVAGISDTGAKMYTVGYLHALSKRTLVRAVVSKISNDTNAAFNFQNNAVAGGIGVGADPKGVSVGVRHSF